MLEDVYNWIRTKNTWKRGVHFVKEYLTYSTMTPKTWQYLPTDFWQIKTVHCGYLTAHRCMFINKYRRIPEHHGLQQHNPHFSTSFLSASYLKWQKYFHFLQWTDYKRIIDNWANWFQVSLAQGAGSIYFSVFDNYVNFFMSIQCSRTSLYFLCLEITLNSVIRYAPNMPATISAYLGKVSSSWSSLIATFTSEFGIWKWQFCWIIAYFVQTKMKQWTICHPR